MAIKQRHIPLDGALTAPLRYLSNYQSALKQIMGWITDVYPDAIVTDVHRSMLIVRISGQLFRARLCSDGISLVPVSRDENEDVSHIPQFSIDHSRPYGVGDVIDLPDPEIRRIMNMRPKERREALLNLAVELFPGAVFSKASGYSVYVHVNGDEYRATVNSKGVYFLKTRHSVSYKLDILIETPDSCEDLARKCITALGEGAGFLGISKDKPSCGYDVLVFENDGVHYRSRCNDGVFGLQGGWKYRTSRIKTAAVELFAKINYPDEELEPDDAAKRFKESRIAGKVIRIIG